MRLKLAIAAVLGMLLGLVPLTGVVQAGADTTASIRIVHSVMTGAGAGPAVDVYVDGTKALTALAFGDFVDTTLPSGTHVVVVCANPSLTSACASPSSVVVAATPLTVVANNAYTVVATGNTLTSASLTDPIVSQQTPTGYDHARLQLNNVLPVALTVCIDGVAVVGLTGVLPGASGFAEIPAGVHNFTYGPTCDPAKTKAIEFPAGTAWVFTAVLAASVNPLANATTPRILVVGEGRPENTPATPAFCTDVTTFGTASKALTGLLSTIVVGNTSTYPTADALNAAIDATVAVIDSGDMNVPETIKPQWEILTGGLRSLIAGLQLVGGDVSKLPAASLTTIVAGINSPVKNPETTGATEMLTKWYISNCIAAPTPAPADPPATPKYTG